MNTNSNGGGTHISGQNITIGAMATGDHSTATSYQAPPQAEPQRQQEPIRVLFVSSDPYGTIGTQLNREWQTIQEAWRLSSLRERIEIHELRATTPDSLRRKLLERPFHIVHIAGQGTSAGIVLADELGRPYAISQQALAQCFENHRQTLRCVLLNVSSLPLTYSELGVPRLIVLSGAPNGQAALVFTRGFYDALGAGTDLNRAYREGLNAVRFASLERDFLAFWYGE